MPNESGDNDDDDGEVDAHTCVQWVDTLTLQLSGNALVGPDLVMVGVIVTGQSSCGHMRIVGEHADITAIWTLVNQP